MTWEWPQLICLGVVLLYHFYFTLATPPLVPELEANKVKEHLHIEPDMIEDWPHLTAQPAERRAVSDQYFHASSLNAPSPFFYPHDDNFQPNGELLLSHDPHFVTWMEQEFSNHLETVTRSSGSPSGERTNSMIFIDVNADKDPFLSWIGQSPSDHLGPARRVGTPSGESLNSMVGNDAKAYKERVEQVSNPDETTNFIQVKHSTSIVGKHPRDRPAEELDHPLKVAKNFEWHTLSELYSNDVHIATLHKLAEIRLKEDHEYITITQEYIQTVGKQLHAIFARGKRLFKKIPESDIPSIRIFKLENSAGDNAHHYKIRLLDGKGLMRRETINTRAVKIIQALSRYHNLFRLGGLDQFMFGETGRRQKDLLGWFLNILLEGSDKRWPLIGQMTSQEDPVFHRQFFQSKAQQYLINLLSSNTDSGKTVNMKLGLMAAIELMGFWYEQSTSGISHTDTSTISLNPPRIFNKKHYETQVVLALQKNHYRTTQMKIKHDLQLQNL